MTDAAAEPWADITPVDVVRLLAPLSIRWWIAGGWALELTGDPPRPHGDIDVAVLRPEHERLRSDLAGWDLRVARDGRLRPWHGGPVELPANAVWARPSSADAWHIDFKIELVDGEDWVHRRDGEVRRPVSQLGTITRGIPHLRREIVELYAAAGVASRRPSRASSRTTARRRAGTGRRRRPHRRDTRRALR